MDHIHRAVSVWLIAREDKIYNMSSIDLIFLCEFVKCLFYKISVVALLCPARSFGTTGQEN